MTEVISYELVPYPLEGVELNDSVHSKELRFQTKRIIKHKTKEQCRLLFIYQGLMFFEKIESVKEGEQ